MDFHEAVIERLASKPRGIVKIGGRKFPQGDDVPTEEQRIDDLEFAVAGLAEAVDALAREIVGMRRDFIASR